VLSRTAEAKATSPERGRKEGKKAREHEPSKLQLTCIVIRELSFNVCSGLCTFAVSEIEQTLPPFLLDSCHLNSSDLIRLLRDGRVPVARLVRLHLALAVAIARAEEAGGGDAGGHREATGLRHAPHHAHWRGDGGHAGQAVGRHLPQELCEEELESGE
jgi:hypothetical protein